MSALEHTGVDGSQLALWIWVKKIFFPFIEANEIEDTDRAMLYPK